MQRIISLDSQILNSVQKCARFTSFAFIENLQPAEKATALEKGDLLHKLLEMYEGTLGDCLLEGSEMWELNKSFNWPNIPDSYDARWEAARARAESIAPYFASKMTLPEEDVEMILFQFDAYTKHYKDDGWRPLVVEGVGSKILHEDDEIKIVYNFKVDKIAEKGNLILPWDHKSSSRRDEVSSLSNQFMGYCWGLGMTNFLVNKIGFQKTLKPEERFQRFILQYSPARIEEWREWSVYWARVLDGFIQNETFPPNLTSCDKYSGCIYKGICEKDPEGRDWVKERDFKRGETWDVARVLEAK